MYPAAPTTASATTPNEMGALTPAIPANMARLAVGYRHNCVLLINGQLKCWGSNEEGQLGLEDITGNKEIIGDQPNEIAALAVTALKPGTPWKS